MTAPSRNNQAQVYSAAFFALEIDGINGKRGDALPTLRSVEGGGVKAKVIDYQMGEHGDVWRQLGKPIYEPIKITLGLADTAGFFDWIADFQAGNHPRRNGAIVAADHDYRERARRQFTDAIVTELGFPKWDANDNKAVNITVTLDPEKIEFLPPAGDTVINERGAGGPQQKHITACNFDFDIKGYEQACARCSKVDAFSIKVKTIEHHHGNQIAPTKVPGKMEWPNLVFYIPEADAEPFRALHNQRMVGKQADRGQGLQASLRFFNNQRVDRGEFAFRGVHIFNVSSEKADASTEDMKLVKIECAVEGITFSLKP